MSQEVSVLKGTSIVSSLTLLSRLLGFIRDVLVARLFGSGAYADAFFVAFRIPNLLRSIFAEGALTSAFIPVFASEMKSSMEAARRTFRSINSLLLLSTCLLSLAGILFAPAIVRLFAPGFSASPEKFDLCVRLTQIMLPYIAFVSMISLLNGALNSVKVFGASALAQVIMNVVLIAGAILAAFFGARDAVLILAVSVIVGGLAQILAQIPALRRAGFSLLPCKSIFTPATRSVLKLMLPAILGATVYQISIFFNTMMASLISEGSVSWLFYADRLTQLPIGIFSIALASVLLPALSHAHADGDRSNFDTHLGNALRFSSFIMIPICTALGCLALPLVQLLFQRGQFTHDSSIQTAAAVQAYAFGLWSVSCHSMIVRAFVAQKDTLTSTLVGIASLILTVIFSLLLVGPLTETTGLLGRSLGGLQGLLSAMVPSPSLGHVGLALSSSLASLVALAIIAFRFHRGHSDFGWGGFGASTVKALIAAGGMGTLLTLLQRHFQSSGPAVILSLSVPIGALSYVAIGMLLKNSELRETFALLRRLISRRPAA